MYIPGITKIKVKIEEAKQVKRDLNREKLTNADLREENRELKLKNTHYHNALLNIKLEAEKHCNNCMYLEKIIFDEIKELDVSKTS